MLTEEKYTRLVLLESLTEPFVFVRLSTPDKKKQVLLTVNPRLLSNVLPIVPSFC